MNDRLRHFFRRPSGAIDTQTCKRREQRGFPCLDPGDENLRVSRS